MRIRMGVMTSGGDAPGMNAALRAVVRTGLELGGEVYAIYEGYKGLIAGATYIRPVDWSSVGGILHQGGTVFGTARSPEFRTREGRLQAARHLVQRGIDRLVIIGGDGSLTGAHVLRQEWPHLLQELVEAGQVAPALAERHPHLAVVGLVGTIDNDMYGTDMTIGADTALHRIVDAIDAISSTAASHQRTFVVEVMGRRCGYLALMGGLASAADWVLIPESPPDVPDWEAKMCRVLREGRKAGRRDSIVVLAEGAVDREGRPITRDYLKQVLEEGLGEEVRVTVLGHVQRGGSPSAYDRLLSTILGAAAAWTAVHPEPGQDAVLVGIRNNRVVRLPLMECVERTREVNGYLENREFHRAMELRGASFQDAFRILRTLVRALPHPPRPDRRRLRIAVLNAGGPAPGMNPAVRAFVRLAVDRGHIPVGVERGFRGFIDGKLREMDWMSVNGWAPVGGSELGTSRKIPAGGELYQLARTIEEWQIDAVVMIGGWAGYQAMRTLYQAREHFPVFNIPLVCVPATINNNLPGAELSIGADTALNSIVEAVDKIKQSAVASNRAFVVEVMGRYCGYLALMGALASGAERVYLHEEGIRLADLERDIELLRQGFLRGKRLGLMIRNEKANPLYTTPFIAALLEEEGGDLYDVRYAVLGHVQQGGNPTPFDRIMAARFAAYALDYVEEHQDRASGEAGAAVLGLLDGAIRFTPMDQISRAVEEPFQRPREQWWMSLRPLARVLAQPTPGFYREHGEPVALDALFHDPGPLEDWGPDARSEAR